MEMSGKIIAVLEARGGVSSKTGNSWKMQEYVLEEMNVQFPHRMSFSVFGEDKINAMNIQEGQELTVSFDINAREYQGRWYNDLRAWKVEPYTPADAPVAAPMQPQPFATAPAQPAATPAAPEAPFGNADGGESTDDLPF